MPVLRTVRGWLPLAVALLVLACTVHSQAGSNAFYVSPDGTPYGDGSAAHPWDLKTALAQPSAVRPGDTIWLRGGIYRGTYDANLNGTSTAPIKVRQYPGERAIIDGGNSHSANILEV